MSALPDRIWIMGPTGSGKSTLAAKLGEALDYPVTHMDDIHWQPNWVEAPREETIARVQEKAQAERWVIEGGYTFVRDTLLDRIEQFVWLDIPLWVRLPRLIRRGVDRSVNKIPCCNGNYETLRRTFFDRDSLLLFAVQHSRITRRKALATLAQAPETPYVRLRKPKAVAAWFEEVTR